MAITKISKEGLELIKAFEGLRLTAYQDCIGVWTIGYGTTSSDKGITGKSIVKGMIITKEQAIKWLEESVNAKYAPKVSKYDSTYHWNQNEFDALVSFAYNIGSIDQLVDNGKRTKAVIAEKIVAYNKAGGKVVQGLTDRRKKEQALFKKPVVKEESTVATTTTTTYYVRKSWKDAAIGKYTSLTKAKQVADINIGTFVFNSSKVPVYPVPYSVTIKETDIYAEKSGKTISAKEAKAAAGTYTIVKVSGARGELKSGAGWIDLSTCATGYTFAKTPGQKVAEQAKKIGKYMVENKYHYGKIGTDKGSPTSFEASKKAGYHNATCTRFASWALQEAGYLTKGKCLSHTMGNKSQLKNCEIINIKSKFGKKMTFQDLYNKNELHIGDVMISDKNSCGNNYASVFAGYHDNKKCHYEAGGPFKGTNTTKTAPYVYTNVGPLYVGYDWTHYVEFIVRPKV